MKHTTRTMVGAALAVALLTGCGGGGTSDDTKFLDNTYQAAKAEGYPTTTEGEQARLDLGHLTCDWLKAGSSYDAAELQLMNAGLSPAFASVMVTQAVGNLCPEVSY